MNKWDERFLNLAKVVASWSKDVTPVGCVIVGPNREIRSVGYNGPPRGVNDEVAERKVRPEKYHWNEHAERNAVYNAARMGTMLDGCSAYLPWYPCADCARALIQSGIIKVVCGKAPNFSDPQWGASFRAAEIMMREAGIEVFIR